MALCYLGERFQITGAYRSLEVFRLVAELLKAGLGGKVWHDVSFRRLRSASQAERRNACHQDKRHRTGGLCPSRGPGAPCEPASRIPADGQLRLLTILLNISRIGSCERSRMRSPGALAERAALPAPAVPP